MAGSNFVEYGAYHASKFMLEFNREFVLPGDFHRYILNDVADAIQNPQRTGTDPIHFFSGTDIIDEVHKDQDSILESMFTVFHETAHLIQDFTLGSQILRDSLYDVISGQSYAFLKLYEMSERQLPLPLIRLENYLCNEKSAVLRELYDIIYKRCVCIGYPDGSSISIGTNDLLEAFAAARAFYQMIRTEPEAVRNNEINFILHNKNQLSAYRKAWSAYEKAFIRKENIYMGGALTYEQSLDMTGFLLICDIALHIPALEFNDCFQKDYTVPEYYLPYIRFAQIGITLARNNGFPDAVEGEDFYITLFNFIAERNGWPTFKETYDSWCAFLAKRMMQGFMVSDGYRILCAEYKRNNANELFNTWLGSFFVRTGIPALVRYYYDDESFFEYVRISGFTQMTVMDNHLISPFKDPYEIMTDEGYRNTWSADAFFKEINKGGRTLWPLKAGTTFLREIFCRIISKEFFRAVLEEDSLSCPMAKLRCLAKTDACYCLKNLTGLPERCSLAVWLRDLNIQPHFFYWR